MIIVLNPNASVATTEMMTGIARTAAPGRVFAGLNVAQGPQMITTGPELAASAAEVARMAPALAQAEGVIVAAFGDPGLDALRAQLACPVVGIGESSFLEAGAEGRRFGIATTTPDLVGAIAARVRAAGMEDRFTGCEITPGDPFAVTADPERLFLALRDAAGRCLRAGAEAIVIGGGPLAQAAERLRAETGVPVVAPVPAAARRIARLTSG